MPRPKPVSEEQQQQGNFAFDDDTSDSDEDLTSFKDKVGNIKNNKASNEDTSEDEDMEEDDEDESDSDEDDSSEKDDDDLPLPVMSEAKKSKLSGVLEQLNTIGGGGASSDDTSDEKDEEEDRTKEKKKKKKVKVQQSAGESSNEEEEEDGEDITDEPSEEIEGDIKPKAAVVHAKMTGEERVKKKFRDQLSQMTLEDIQKLKDRLGVKLFNQKMSGTAPERGRKVEFRRENKNRPREMSSKKTVGRFREVVPVTKVERRDPRFDPLCGEFDDKLFKESYQFVNEIKAGELVDLKKQIKAEEDPERRKTIKYLIERMENQLRAEALNQVKLAKEASETAERKTQLKAGEKPFYESKARQKEAKLVEQYEELKEKGGLDTFIKKKTKKNLGKERKKQIGVLQR